LVLISATSGAQSPESRVRNLLYVPDQVIRVRGWVGYHVDLTFEEGESFVTLGGGDLEALTVGSYANHLVLKPKASSLRTNLTVFTNRRTYLLDYAVSPRTPDPLTDDLVFAIHLLYPVTNTVPVVKTLAAAPELRMRQEDYWYCGASDLRPIEAFDDGAHTYLRFAPAAEMPAIFVRGEDGKEALLNFSVKEGQVQIHRLARRFILRRGRLTGCVVNKGYIGSGERLDSGTVSPQVKRERKEMP
jgi:type IV secretion system protein VirB9